MCHAKNQFCNMNRFVLILLLLLFNMVGTYAYTTNNHVPAYSMRSVNCALSTNNSTLENATQYRVSNNAFSSVPSMQVNTIVKSSSKYSQEGFIEPGASSPSGSRKIRGPQRAVDEDDKTDEDVNEPEKNDPYGTPLSDAVLPLLLLAAGYVFFIARKRRALKKS